MVQFNGVSQGEFYHGVGELVSPNTLGVCYMVKGPCLGIYANVAIPDKGQDNFRDP